MTFAQIPQSDVGVYTDVNQSVQPTQAAITFVARAATYVRSCLNRTKHYTLTPYRYGAGLANNGICMDWSDNDGNRASLTFLITGQRSQLTNDLMTEVSVADPSDALLLARLVACQVNGHSMGLL